MLSESHRSTVTTTPRRAGVVRVGTRRTRVWRNRRAAGETRRDQHVGNPPQASIRPGTPWLDTKGERIQAHGGSILHVDGTFHWYGENKEKTLPGSGIWRWGIRCHTSTDLYNWEDRGLIIPPVPDDPDSPLHPSKQVDRPHIVHDKHTGQFVCRLKIMGDIQESTVLVTDTIEGPYRVVRTRVRPLGTDRLSNTTCRSSWASPTASTASRPAASWPSANRTRSATTPRSSPVASAPTNAPSNAAEPHREPIFRTRRQEYPDDVEPYPYPHRCDSFRTLEIEVIRVSFNDDWQFRPKVNLFAEMTGTAVPYQPVTLPHDAMIGQERRAPGGQAATDSGGAGAYFPGGTFEYRKTFFVPEEYRGKRVFFEFEGIHRDAIVHINRDYAGQRPYG